MDQELEPIKANNEPKLTVNGMPPLMTQEKFADFIGLSGDTVEHQVKRGYYPTIKIGKRRLINMVALVEILKTDSDHLG